MCAINGFTWEDRALAERMNARTAHRGPDGSGITAAPGITLGHNRLAIIDLSAAAAQPMSDADNRYLIAFNGEIYNFRELRKDLGGYPFRTQSDTEVIVAAYATWGREAFTRLNGIYALALWDREKSELVLVRDPAGVKPLYYHYANGRLVFSSEIKALLEASVPRTLDREALGHYLRLMYVPEPQTMFASVSALLPGHMLTYREREVVVTPFAYKASRSDAPRTYREAQAVVRTQVKHAVRRQLVSDRPVGIYLSGGIDSSTILACAAESHAGINTYSVGFDLRDNEEVLKFNKDAALARRTAAYFGAMHHEFFLSSDDAFDLLLPTVRQLDQPIGNATAIAQQFLAAEVKPTATVVLSGEGGDELFGGYERYRLAYLASLARTFVPAFAESWSRRLMDVRRTGVERFAQLMFQKDATLARALSSSYHLPDTRKLYAHFFAGGDIAAELMRADERSWLVSEALMRADKTAMASGVEVRVPLLDLELGALVREMPRPFKVSATGTKLVLKDAFRDVLPDELFRQPKRGWFSPGAKWLRHPRFVSLADEVLSPSYAPAVSSLLDFEGARGLWEDHVSGRHYNYTAVWGILIFLLWAREYKVEV